MSRKAGKKRHTLLIVLAILLAVPTIGALILMTHTQIIVGAIQKLAADTVNTVNSYEPSGEPMEGIKDNGQYIITELKYSENYPNSFLDITYPDENRETSRCAEGFNLVNIDYVLVPEYHFPAPLIQANEAFRFLIDHADEYHLDMDRVVIMGSSAGAIMTSQLGSVITNPDYAAALGISPVLRPEQIKAVVLDDAPLVYDKFSLGTKVLVGNYVKGSVFLSREEKQKYNNILWVDSNYPDAFLLGSEYYADMREMDSALTGANAEHALVDPLAERNLQMQHCFVASERENDVAKDAFDRMISFLKQRVQ